MNVPAAGSSIQSQVSVADRTSHGVSQGFSLLPPEIQSRIFEFAIPGPRLVKLKLRTVHGSFAGNAINNQRCFGESASLALLHICKCSRYIACWYYTPEFEGILAFPVYLDLRRDALSFSRFETLSHFFRGGQDPPRFARDRYPLLVFDMDLGQATQYQGGVEDALNGPLTSLSETLRVQTPGQLRFFEEVVFLYPFAVYDEWGNLRIAPEDAQFPKLISSDEFNYLISVGARRGEDGHIYLERGLCVKVLGYNGNGIRRQDEWFHRVSEFVNFYVSFSRGAYENVRRTQPDLEPFVMPTVALMTREELLERQARK